MMNAEHVVVNDDDTLLHAPPNSAHSLLSIMQVLQPATPPTPKNARVIRRFDLDIDARVPEAEADAEVEAELEVCPEIEAPLAGAIQAARPHVRNRENTRAQRNKSLLAAARLA